MIVSEIMTTDVTTCTPDTDLQQVVQRMLERECGFLPVVDRAGATVGTITDRDVCIAVAMRRRTPARIRVAEAMSHPVFACRPEDRVTTALGTMSAHRVRRLPVVDQDNRLRGVLTMNDIVLAHARHGAPTAEDVVAALTAICRRRVEELVPV